MYTRGIPATAAARPGPSPLRRRPAERDRGDGSSGDGGNGRAARPTQPNPSDVREHALDGRALPVSPALPAGGGGNGRERAFASRPAAVRAGLARGRAGVGRGQVMDGRHRRRGGPRGPPPSPGTSSRELAVARPAAPTAGFALWAEVPALSHPPVRRSRFCLWNREWFPLEQELWS